MEQWRQICSVRSVLQMFACLRQCLLHQNLLTRPHLDHVSERLATHGLARQHGAIHGSATLDYDLAAQG